MNEAVVGPPRRSAGQTIARNTIFGLGAQLALRVFGFLFSILVARTLGDAAFGQYSVVLAWAGLFSVIGDVGVTQYMTREISRDPNRANDLFWNTAGLRFILSIVAIVVTTLAAAARPFEPQVVLAVGLYTLSYFLQALLAPLQSIIAGNERLDILSVFTIIGQIIFMVAGGLFLVAGFDFVWLVIASLLNLPVLIALSLWVVRRYQMRPPRFRLEPRTWGTLLLAGVPFALIQLALTFNFRVDTLILEAWRPSEVVGWYNAAYNFTRSLLVFASAFIIAAPITLAREYVLDPKSILPWYYRTTKFMLFVGLPMAVGGTLLSDKIVRLLFGGEYAPAAVAFAILIWDTPLLMYTALCGNLMAAIKKERYSVGIYVSLALLNVVLNLIFIPQYGLIAASVMTVAAEVTGAILFYRFFRQEFGSGLGAKQVMRLIVAAAVMGVVVYLLRGSHLLINISISSAIYLVIVWRIGAFTDEERALLSGLVKRKLGRLLRR